MLSNVCTDPLTATSRHSLNRAGRLLQEEHRSSGSRDVVSQAHM
jgi:hypothetical protein